MAAYEWFRPHGAKHAVRRLRPKNHEFVEVTERYQPVVVNAAPHANFEEDIGNLCNNQHVIHQRINQMEAQQERLISASEMIFRQGVKQAQKLDSIDSELQYGSKVHTRPDPLYLRERDASHIAARPKESLLLDGGDFRHQQHYRSGGIDRADRAYIGDGVTYITSRHARRPSWQPRHYADSDSSSDSGSSVFDYEPPRRPKRRPVIHQRACECGGIGYHLTDCPLRARW
ncbi:hypothetical protein GP486_004313 [Trichoglossum hirsutum]|uniref:Uncharacterized protein n=1 Tax=Trichoglossum hirsutum TaxID=265104 RepID=A0A9P8LBA5_9PEZI|nr:hypothetical protein GP486_004313 [Trichoglossum hirsutum]